MASYHLLCPNSHFVLSNLKKIKIMSTSSSSSSSTYPPLMQNSHDDGSTAALRRLYMFLLMWEVMYHVARIFIKVLLEKYPNIVIINNTEKKDDDNNTDSDATSATQGSNDTKSSSSSTVGNNSNNNNNIKQTLLQRGPSYLVSFFHSIITTMRGTMHLYHLWGASNFDKIYIPSKASYNAYDGSTIITYRWAHLHVATTNTLFLSYLLYDLFHILLQYPRLGGVDTILHHVLFAFCSFINGTYGLMAFQFGWLIVGELSTIFLNVRWFLIKITNNSLDGGGSTNGSNSDKPPFHHQHHLLPPPSVAPSSSSSPSIKGFHAMKMPCLGNVRGKKRAN